MPSQPKSPYATSFRSALNRGVPAGTAVLSIAKRTGKTPNQIFTSLYKADLCERQKINGQFVYWPLEDVKTSATQAKLSQVQMWQHFIDWCIASGNCDPEKLDHQVGSQQDFMNYCKKFFTRQLTGVSSSSSSRKSSKSYKFPSKSSSRSYSPNPTTSVSTRRCCRRRAA